jgi:hypothetical protein
MWDTVGIIAAVVVIILLIQLLDFSEVLKARLRGESPQVGSEGRIAEIERRLSAIEKKLG